MNERDYSPLDRILVSFETGLRTLFGNPISSGRSNPANQVNTDTVEPLNNEQKKVSAGLMRINHAGEVCAQALYQGQALTARNPKTRESMQTASIEENDHLLWCSQRIHELEGHTSYLNPFWYCGSLTIGLLAGALGDKWNLGFLAETEHQVVKHLEGHLQKLPDNDLKSKTIVSQMKTDEAKHAELARQSGAAELPLLVKKFMAVTAKVMVKTSYRI